LYRFQKFRAKKFQTTITFDRELGLRRFKNKSCLKWGNKAADFFFIFSYFLSIF